MSCCPVGSWPGLWFYCFSQSMITFSLFEIIQVFAVVYICILSHLCTVCCCPCSCLTVTNSFCHCCRTFPIRGFQIYDGPVQLTQSTFRGFMPRLERYTSAVGFSLKNTWQLTPRNNLSHLSFQSTVSGFKNDVVLTLQNTAFQWL